MFHCDWEEGGLEKLKEDFDIEDDVLVGVEILFAAYTYVDYSGSAFVLFRKDGKLWEVNGGHCSCYGLEDQWEPEETTVEAIRERVVVESYHFEGFIPELNSVLDSLVVH